MLCTTTCCADAYADGQRLGEQHVALLHAEQLTLPRLSSEFEAGRAAHRSHQAQLDFSEGYAASIAPVRAQLAALARDHAARTSARALIDGLEALGQDLGHAAGTAVPAEGRRPRRARPSCARSGARSDR